jgi:hypothetical protein
MQKSFHLYPYHLQINKSVDRQQTQIIDKHRKNNGEEIYPCKTPEHKERCEDFTLSTSTTRERSRRNEKNMRLPNNSQLPHRRKNRSDRMIENMKT